MYENLLKLATIYYKYANQAVINLAKAEIFITKYFNDLVRWSENNSGSFSEQDAIESTQGILLEVKSQMEKMAAVIQTATTQISDWQGSQIVIEPSFAGDDPFYNEEGGLREFSAYVTVGSNRDAGFTVFSEGGKFIIDDIIDAGEDEDGLFTSQTESADYYKLINELRNPGRSKLEGEKVITVYTARPKKDRSLYQGATTIPSNIFVTSSFQEAQGYSLEFGGERDIYRLRVKQKYLMETLNSGAVKNYQVWDPSGTVPIDKITLL